MPGTISWCVCPMPWAAWWRRCMTVHRSKKVDYTPEGIEIEAVVDGILYGRLREYIIGEC